LYDIFCCFIIALSIRFANTLALSSCRKRRNGYLWCFGENSDTGVRLLNPNFHI